jgi:hypothetical protein
MLRRGSLFLGPVELGFVDPHQMQNNEGELGRNGDLCLAEPASLRKPDAPGFKRRPFSHAGQQYTGRFEQIHAEHGVTALRPVDLSGGMARSRRPRAASERLS